MSVSIKVEVKQVKPMTVAYLNVKGHFGQIPAAFNRLYSWINEKGYIAHGPAIAVFHDIPGQVPDDQVRWELRSRVTDDTPVTVRDEQGPGVKHVETVQAATTIYKGLSENMEGIYQALTNWITENGYEINGPVEELYYNNPANPEENVTEIRYPVRKRQ